MTNSCLDCKHREALKCLEGHTTSINEWFNINKDRTRKMGFKNNHSCFEPHKINIILDDANQLVEKLLNKLDK